MKSFKLSEHLALEVLRMWNSELPIPPKWDCLDLFSGQSSVKADSMYFQLYLKVLCALKRNAICQDALVRFGYSVSSHDIEIQSSMDFNSAAGFGSGAHQLKCLLLPRFLFLIV